MDNVESCLTDDEILYRSVRGGEDHDEYEYDDFGNLIIKPEAFKDRNKEPSVDRAKLRNYNPALSKLSSTDGIVELLTGDVREIGNVESTKDDKKKLHSVDVIYKPVTAIEDIPENLAHSEVTVSPQFFGNDKKQKKAFKLLRISLARLATQKGWLVAPNTLLIPIENQPSCNIAFKEYLEYLKAIKGKVAYPRGRYWREQY
jgi:hypothetical protein